MWQDSIRWSGALSFLALFIGFESYIARVLVQFEKLEPVEFASPLSIQEFLPAFEFSSTKTTCRIRHPSWMPHTKSAHGCRCSLARLGDRSTTGKCFMGRDGPACFSLMADQDHQGYWRGDPHQEGRWICVSWRFLWFWEGLFFLV